MLKGKVDVHLKNVKCYDDGSQNIKNNVKLQNRSLFSKRERLERKVERLFWKFPSFFV